MWRDQTGSVAIVAALAMTLLVGVVGLAVDVSMWYRITRSLQNAADSAVIAATINGTSTYQSEAKAVAAKYGFVDGASGITVAALANQTCPDTSPDCYKVTITQASAPVYFFAVLGLSGSALSASAIAGGSNHTYCLLALAGSGADPAISSSGAPATDLTNCTLMSNTAARCTGHNLNATYGDAHETDNGCGITQNSNMPTVSDPYAYLATSIPANTCGVLYPQEPSALVTKWTGARTLGATTIVCGDLQLTGNTTLTTASPGSVLVIENGRLDVNNYTLQTAAGSALTIIFSGTSGSYTHAPTNSGTLNFNAPTTGTWKGMAIYQDPALTTGVNISAAGSSPTWNITGMVYLPHATVSFSGAVNKSNSGYACFGMVADNISINGGGSILETGQCGLAGLNLPTSDLGHVKLLQ